MKRIATIFVLGFLALFVLRLGYGFYAFPNGERLDTNHAVFNQSFDFELSRKNYAGQKGSVAALPSVDQRFEKVATLGMISHQFDADEARIREIGRASEALVQHEQAYGLEGRRQLQLALGVNPDRFDAVIEQLSGIGTQTSFHVTKVDKTNEYQTLIAQQNSLKKSRDNLVALKSRDAELDDLIALETRILDLENQIQNLGVSVGEFDSEFEFVTIKITLVETKQAQLRQLSLASRAFTAFTWTVQYYLGICAAFALMLAGAALLTFTVKGMRDISSNSK